MKVRIGAGGANLKTVSALHVRTAAGAGGPGAGAGGLKTVPTAHIRIGAGGANQKTAYSSAPPAGNSVSILPRSHVTYSVNSHTNVTDFTATPSGASVVSYTWALEGLSGGTATILSGQGTAVARVQLVASGSAPVECTVRCTVHFSAGLNATDTALMRHTYTGP